MKRTTVEEFDAEGKLTKRTTTEVCEDEVVKRIEFVPIYPYTPVPYPSVPGDTIRPWEPWKPSVTYITTGGSTTQEIVP